MKQNDVTKTLIIFQFEIVINIFISFFILSSQGPPQWRIQNVQEEEA